MSEPSLHVFGSSAPIRPREMTVREYAEYERVTIRTVRNWIEKKAVSIRRTPTGGVRIVCEMGEKR